MWRGEFVKYEGLGNDFIVIDADADDVISAEEVTSLCDRRRGIGADGVLLFLTPRSAEHAGRMRVLNADGSVPEMCGNGLRCIALHWAVREGERRAEVTFETDAGPRACTIHAEESVAEVRVDMGEVRRLGEDALDVSGVAWKFHLGDAGNPHAIAFGEFDRATAERVGPVVETHPRFPRGTNVELATIRDGLIDLIVWERGVGITLACGTGACATAVAARELGLVDAGPVRVRLLGGELLIEPDPKGHTFMTGPARRVFAGSVP